MGVVGSSSAYHNITYPLNIKVDFVEDFEFLKYLLYILLFYVHSVSKHSNRSKFSSFVHELIGVENYTEA